jgi:hypothetical protein
MGDMLYSPGPHASSFSGILKMNPPHCEDVSVMAPGMFRMVLGGVASMLSKKNCT